MENQVKDLCKLSLTAIQECREKVISLIKEMGVELNMIIHRELDECYSDATLTKIDNGVLYLFDGYLGNITENVEDISLNEMYDIISYISIK